MTVLYRLSVVVRFQFQGFHAWPSAPDEVDFLSQRHRHVFHVRARREVQGPDRETEFITLKNRMESFVARRWAGGELGDLSCEMIAVILCNEFGLDACEVAEDGENGGLAVKDETF